MYTLADKVKCNWCEKESFIERTSDKCPSCKKVGYLMDINQDIEISNQLIGKEDVGHEYT